jgi:hypothetical protein
MSSFQVTPASLRDGAAALSLSPAPVSLGDEGAAGGTPAAAAWMEFAGRADQSLTAGREAVVGLARALQTAASAYELADASAASSLQVGR